MLGKLEDNIPEELQESFYQELSDLLDEVSYKRTNKLDLSVGDLMFFDVISTSKTLKSMGIQCSYNPERTKKKRTPNGYISNFYGFDIDNDGLDLDIDNDNLVVKNVEVQLQGRYRFEYGEHGPAAHHSMDNGIKKRTLYKPPSNDKDYKVWERKQFLSLPKYFAYKGNGLVHIYNALDNFSRYYDCEQEEVVKQYVKFILSHNLDSLYNKFKKFSLAPNNSLSPKNDDKKNAIKYGEDR